MSTAHGTPPVVLLVDDEPSILSALRRLLRPEGYQILLANGGQEGLELLADEPVDLVISDMRMPEMDGASFLEQVRERWPDVGRILLTGYADISSTVAAINRSEIHRYVAKPWDDRELLLVVEDALERQRLSRENKALLAKTEAQNAELHQLNTRLEVRVRERTAELGQLNAMLEKSYEQMREEFRLSLDIFANLIELRDGGTGGYSRRVAHLARAMLRQCGADEPSAEEAYFAGLLHEIGKIGLPDRLLHKPLSTMTADELGQWHRHPLVGEAALMPLRGLRRVAKLIRAQDERFDGKGLPDGLSGASIPIAAQALRIASDFHAAQAGRLAERHMSPQQALELIRGGAGTRYAPALVEALQACLDQPLELGSDEFMIEASAVEPGMVLAQDLLGPRGSLLLAAGFVFDEALLRQLRNFTAREGLTLTMVVKRPTASSHTSPSSLAALEHT